MILKLYKKLFKIRKWKIFLTLGAILIIFNELILYEWCYWKWILNNKSDASVNSKIYNILFVADPQLIGMEYEYKFFGPVIRWDADRFIKSGFSRAMQYTNPDYVVFLGDIFDEGEIASDSQFNSYMLRFKYVFTDLMYNKTTVIIIPGDNDIGGENMEPRTRDIVTRFTKRFSHTFPYSQPVGSNIHFIAADIRSDTDFSSTLYHIQNNLPHSKLNILLNHESVDMEKKLLKGKSDIQLVVTAHTHLSKYKFCNYCSYGINSWSPSIKLESYDKITFNLSPRSSTIIQITVPTCSYRMGVPFPGYGYLKVSEDGNILYRVLWLPYRYYSLATYDAFVILIVIILFCTCIRR